MKIEDLLRQASGLRLRHRNLQKHEEDEREEAEGGHGPDPDNQPAGTHAGTIARAPRLLFPFAVGVVRPASFPASAFAVPHRPRRQGTGGQTSQVASARSAAIFARRTSNSLM